LRSRSKNVAAKRVNFELLPLTRNCCSTLRSCHTRRGPRKTRL